MEKPVYLDYNGTTPTDLRVAQVVLEESSFPLNPSSIHAFGREAKKKLQQAREKIAHVLKVKPQEIIFTSGGTESLNLVLRGLCAKIPRGAHIISSNVEHPAVFYTLKEIEKQGYRVSFLPAGPWGAVTTEAVEKAITPETQLLVLMAANNETGVKTDIESIAAIAEQHHIPFVVDGIAFFGKEEWHGIPPGVTAFCLSGHKIHGPRGTGLAFIRKGTRFPSILTGGGQERNLRSGTENLPGIMGLAKAFSLFQEEEKERLKIMKAHLHFFESELFRHVPQTHRNGEGPRVANVSNLYFEQIDGESLLIQLDLAGVMASHGSSCRAGTMELSRILLNMQYPPARVRSSIRFSFSHLNTKEELILSIKTMRNAIASLRKISHSFSP